ncbi:MAG TPA: hypothetical protein DDZ89_15510 [Clostridiales bacterium]|nr:hypothetical protein [Clostridiales bacterium]
MKILYATDIHFDNTPNKPHYPYAVKNLEIFWNLLKDKMETFDLFIGGGDLVVKGPGCIEELADFKEKLESVTYKYIVTPGNHDICPLKGMEKTYPGVEEYEYKALTDTNYAKVFQDKGLFYSKMFGKCLLIAFAIRNDDPDNQLERLKRELKKPGKKIVFSHYPVYQTRFGGFCAGWDYNRIKGVREKIAKLLATPKHQVAGYFCGHQHINSRVPMTLNEDGTPHLEWKDRSIQGVGWQIETGAATQATCCYKEIEITDTQLIVTTRQLPGVSGLKEGVMNKEKSFDQTHPDITSYHMGNPDEMNFILPI